MYLVLMMQILVMKTAAVMIAAGGDGVKWQGLLTVRLDLKAA